MTMLRLALSATQPGTWTGAATAYGYVDEVGSGDQYGNPDGLSATRAAFSVAAAAVSLSDAADLYVYERQSLDDLWFGAAHLNAAAGLVTVMSYSQLYGVETGASPGTWQLITADGAWNQIKDIAVSDLSSQAVTISNFVDVEVDADADPVAHTIEIENAKRGSVTAANTGENIQIHYISNEYSWSNTFKVTLGNGNNNISVVPADAIATALVKTLEPMRFNAAPQKTHLDLTVGEGNNTIDNREASATIHLGGGVNQVRLTDGHNEVWFGAGTSTVELYSHGDTPGAYASDAGTNLLHLGSGATQVFLYDNNPATTPWTTVEVTAPASGEPRGSTAIQYGHSDASNTFHGGDWSHLTLDLHGFLAGSRVSVFAQPLNGYSILTVGTTGGQPQWVMYLTGGAPTLSQLHIHLS